MVFFFTPHNADGSQCRDFVVYMGRDKFENEELIKWGLPEDIWFHVDDLSSAHLYLRMPRHSNMADMPEHIIQECCQLVKHNSIQGCKLASVHVVYTPWSNLLKSSGMVVGQVGFHSRALVKRVLVEKRKEVVNRIAKTQREEAVDFAAQRAAYDRDVVSEQRLQRQAHARREEEERERRREEAELRSYTNLQQRDAMVSNTEIASKYTSVEEYEDDFM